VAIYRLLQKSAFGPEEVAGLTAAYERACESLLLNNRKDDPLSELVASKIIEVAQTGERDPIRICARAISELGAAKLEPR
jgi:hypothetical protein